MTTERDIERVLDAWLATGPTDMPDRVFHDALDRIERVPQRRAVRPTRLPAKFSMSKLPLAAAVAALSIGLASAALWLGPGDANNAPAALVPASPSPSTTSDRALPDQLRGSWAAAPRMIPGLSLSETVARWTIDDITLHTDDQGSSMGSKATASGSNEFRLESILGGQGCQKGAVGTYRWALTENETRLTVESLGDDCVARDAYLKGTWSRASCGLSDYLAPGWTCAGRLAAGRYASAIFDPRAATEPRIARPGAVTYEVPDGWVNAHDWHSRLMLVPLSGSKRLFQDPNALPDQVTIWAPPVTAISLRGPGCEWRADPAGGSTVDSLATWLVSHPDLVAETPAPVTIDGHEGLMVDIDLAIDEETDCPTPFEDWPYEGLPGVALFGDRTGVTPEGRTKNLIHWERGGWDFGSGGLCADCGTDPQRIILLDLDLDGEPLVILVDSEKPEDQAAFVERAMPIIESFRFPE